MSHFWSSTGKGYIEPKRQYGLIGVIDFIQPFLIQSMDKPKVTPNVTTVKKILKNGTIKVENHYKTGYALNEITVKAIDSFDQLPNSNLNNADKLYKILSNGGYTLVANEIGSAREQLRFPTFRILEIGPKPGNRLLGAVNASISAATSAAAAIASGQGLTGVLGSTLDAATPATEFLDNHVMGIYTMTDPVITDVDFGSGLNYTGDEIVEVSLTFKYSNFKYEKNLV